MVLQCELVSGWGLRKRRSVLPCRPCGLGRTFSTDSRLVTVINKTRCWHLHHVADSAAEQNSSSSSSSAAVSDPKCSSASKKSWHQQCSLTAASSFNHSLSHGTSFELESSSSALMVDEPGTSGGRQHGSLLQVDIFDFVIKSYKKYIKKIIKCPKLCLVYNKSTDTKSAWILSNNGEDASPDFTYSNSRMTYITFNSECYFILISLFAKLFGKLAEQLCYLVMLTTSDWNDCWIIEIGLCLFKITYFFW